MDIKVKKALVYGLSLVLVIWCGSLIFIYFRTSTKKLKDASRQELPSTFKLTPEYSNIIKPQYRDRVTVREVYNDKRREPVALLELDQKYFVVLFKINMAVDSSLRNIFHLEQKSIDNTVGYTYRVVANRYYFEFEYLAQNIRPALGIWLTMFGDTVSTPLLNDSLYYVNGIFRNISLRYSETEPVDVIVQGNEQDPEQEMISMNVLLLKREGALYLVLMSPKESKAGMAFDDLFKVIQGCDSTVLPGRRSLRTVAP